VALEDDSGRMAVGGQVGPSGAARPGHPRGAATTWSKSRSRMTG